MNAADPGNGAGAGGGAREEIVALDESLETLRRRLRTRVRRRLREAGLEGPGAGAFGVLERLIVGGPAAPAALAAYLEVRTSTMTAHIDRLAEVGWARRETVQQGTTRVRVSATEEGRRAYERYVEIRRDTLAALTAHLTDTERHALGVLLRRAVQGPEGPDTPEPEIDRNEGTESALG